MVPAAWWPPPLPPPLTHSPPQAPHACSLVATPELKETLAALAKHRHPDVAALAGGVLAQWLAGMAAQIQVLGHPRYVEDPRAALEAT